MDQAAEVREKIDIVSFISEYLPLKKAGRNFKTNCPFHTEKSPSFIVSPERQIWHCFGCQKGGDVFTFLMEYEKMEFVESLRVLAKKAGIELRNSNYDNKIVSEKEKIYTLNKQALKFYQYILLKHALGKKALSYLKEKRGMSEKLIETFSLGFSPSSGSAISSYLINKKGYKKTDLYLAGLAFEQGGRVLDFFRGRLMFPLTDQRGNVVGFSARILEDNPDAPKYINTKETSVYHKGSMFFGFDIAKEEIKKEKRAIIVEGEFDVIACFSQGIKNVVAIKGTALTENQVALLARFTPKITLCLDQDVAGFEATKRSMPIIEKKGLTTTIAVLTTGKDPDEAIKKDPLSFKKAVRQDIGVYDYLIDKLVLESDVKTAEGKKKITDELLPLFSEISNEVVKEHYLKKLSSTIDVSLEALKKEMEKLQRGEKKEEAVSLSTEKRKRREMLEEYLIALILQSSNLNSTFETAKKILKDYQFDLPSYQKIMDFMTKVVKSEAKLDAKKIAKGLPSELLSSFDKCYLLPITPFATEEKYLEDLEKVANELADMNLREEKKSALEKKE